MAFRVRLLAAVIAGFAAAGCSKLTPENYAKLKPGPSYEEVTTILRDPTRCDDLMGFKSCRWGDDSRNVTVRFAGDQVLLYSAENVR